MIIKYKEFILEGKYLKYTEKDPEFFLIKDYKRNDDGSIDCYQTVDIAPPIGTSKIYDYKQMGYADYPYKKWEFKKVPIKINKVFGSFFCQSIKGLDLTTGPKYVEGYYNCGGDNKVGSIEDYPLCIIGGDIADFNQFKQVCYIVKKNMEHFIPLVNDKVLFHQQVMRLAPDLIPYYKNIDVPSRKSII